MLSVDENCTIKNNTPQNKRYYNILSLTFLGTLKNLTHPLCTARLCYCYYPGTLDVHSLFGHRCTLSAKPSGKVNGGRLLIS